MDTGDLVSGWHGGCHRASLMGTGVKEGVNLMKEETEEREFQAEGILLQRLQGTGGHGVMR